jgi:hypothetical protein
MSMVPWKPFIAPKNLEIAENGHKISFSTLPKTDWWRTGKIHSTSGAYVGVEQDKPLKDVKSFRLEASISVKGGHQASVKIEKDTCSLRGADPLLFYPGSCESFAYERL